MKAINKLSAKFLFAVALSGLMGLFTSSLIAEESAVTLPGCFQFDFTSKTGNLYQIFIHAPQGPIPKAGSPVIYVTDGNANFPLLVVALQRRPILTGAIIVGIGYSGSDAREHQRLRTRDLLFPVDSEWVKSLPPQQAANMKEEVGGADQFLEFIEQELKPDIERRFQIDPRGQMLFGHSFGGLFVLHVLFHRPQAFQIYHASSPSIWVNDRSILQEIPGFLVRLEEVDHPISLLVSVGEEENPGFGASPSREEILKRRRQGKNASELVKTLQTISPPLKLDVSFEMFAHEDHGTAMLPAANRAIQLLSRVQP